MTDTTVVDDDAAFDALILDLEVSQRRTAYVEQQVADQRAFAISEIRKARRWMRSGVGWQPTYKLLGEIVQGLDHWLDAPDPEGGTNGNSETEKAGDWSPQAFEQGRQAHHDQKGQDAGRDTVDS